jgi:hypothetical protein
MEAATPSIAAFRTAIAMISETEISTEVLEETIDKDLQAITRMLALDEYVALTQRFHNYLHHSAAKQSCILQFSALSSLMAKMFTAGYAAGRQEVIDSEVERTLAAGEPK